MEEEEQIIEDDNISSEAGREEGVASGSLEPREAAFMEGYEDESDDEEDDYGLEDDEKLED
ncbi:MAG: hypothetical protein ACMXYC_01445 [Candidatus Woesearchaeota archaeon]